MVESMFYKMSYPADLTEHFYSTDVPSLFVLIIGINTYTSSRLVRLRGPTTDARAFTEYFKEQLGVPDSQIQVLINEQASRQAIIEAFTALKNDVRIKKGDPIFIFYAGHGGEAEAPAGWEAGGKGAKIQMLMPQNFSDEPGKEVPGIPDYTVAALLNQIAKEKGDNIVSLLLDRLKNSPNLKPRCRLLFSTAATLHPRVVVGQPILSVVLPICLLDMSFPCLQIKIYGERLEREAVASIPSFSTWDCDHTSCYQLANRLSPRKSLEDMDSSRPPY